MAEVVAAEVVGVALVAREEVVELVGGGARGRGPRTDHRRRGRGTGGRR